jgi:GNAT superfamily N-acetyltransferase
MEHVERWQRTFAAQRTVVFVAESKLEGQIIGFASGGEERSKKYPEYPGELYAIYLLRGEQGKGLGTLLTTSVLGRLRQEGFNSVLVWVLAQNPYRHFYERMGGRFLGSQNIQIGEIALEEIAYGWRDTNALVERSKGPSSDS